MGEDKRRWQDSPYHNKPPFLICPVCRDNDLFILKDDLQGTSTVSSGGSYIRAYRLVCQSLGCTGELSLSTYDPRYRDTPLKAKVSEEGWL